LREKTNYFYQWKLNFSAAKESDKEIATGDRPKQKMLPVE
jgi:hypothetical protein